MDNKKLNKEVQNIEDTEQMNNLYRTACRKNFLNSARRITDV